MVLDSHPRFMNLGSPRANILPPLPPPPPSHFRLVSEFTAQPHTTWTYAGWAVLALFVGISIASFVTETVLTVGDAMTHSSYFTFATNNKVASVSMSTSTEPRGSDDGASYYATSTVPKNEYRLANIDKIPKVTATAYLIGDVDTGEVIYEKNGDQVNPLASISKLMTAVIAKEQLSPDRVAIVSRDSYNTFGAEGELLLGEKMRVADLMYPLLMESSNDGAEVLADDFGHEKFMLEMNKKAKVLGMHDTYYEDPSGLNAKNVSTVDDYFILARYIRQKFPEIYDTTRVRQFSILKHQWTNKNAFLNYDNYEGGKNGFIDEAKKTGVELFDTTMARGGKRHLVIIVLKSDDRTGDVLKLLKFVEKNGYYSPEVDATSTNVI